MNTPRQVERIEPYTLHRVVSDGVRGGHGAGVRAVVLPSTFGGFVHVAHSPAQGQTVRAARRDFASDDGFHAGTRRARVHEAVEESARQGSEIDQDRETDGESVRDRKERREGERGRDIRLS